MKRALTYLKVRTWLESLPEDEGVGKCADPEGCPLANFLRAQVGFSVPCVDGDVYADNDDGMGDPVTMPKWAARFVELVDEAPGRYRSITAGKAAQLLRRARG